MEWLFNHGANRRSVGDGVMSVLEQVEDDLLVLVPFLKEPQVRWLLGCLTTRAKKNRRKITLRLVTSGDRANYGPAGSDLQALKALMDTASSEHVVVALRAISSLHAKVYVADGPAALVTSGNLTGGGMQTNIEGAILVADEQIVARIRDDCGQIWAAASDVTAEQVASAQESAQSTEPREAPPAGLLFGAPALHIPKLPESAPSSVAPSATTGKGLEFSGLPAECLTWFRPGKGPEEEVRANVQRFQDELSPYLENLGSDLEKYLAQPADANPKKWEFAPGLVPPRARGWQRHVCTRNQLTSNFPSHWWVALGRHETEYVQWAQLTVGVSAKHGGSGFAGFLLNEEDKRVLNRDRKQFVKGARAHVDEFLDRFNGLPSGMIIYWLDDRGKDVEPVPAGSLTREHILAFSAGDKIRRNLRIERYYTGDERRVFFEPGLVNVVLQDFKLLYDFYYLALRGEFPK